MKYLALLFLFGCSSMTVHDFTACAIAPGQAGVYCDNFLSDHQVFLDQLEWVAIQPGWLAMSPDDFVNIKAELENACSIAKCDYQKLQTGLKKMQAIEASTKPRTR